MSKPFPKFAGTLQMNDEAVLYRFDMAASVLTVTRVLSRVIVTRFFNTPANFLSLQLTSRSGTAPIICDLKYT